MSPWQQLLFVSICRATEGAHWILSIGACQINGGLAECYYFWVCSENERDVRLASEKLDWIDTTPEHNRMADTAAKYWYDVVCRTS